MPDLLEGQLTARLRDLGATVPDDLPVPADLETEVRRRRGRARHARRWSGLAIAAVITGAVFAVTLLHDTPGRRISIDSPATVPVARDSLPAGTVMLSAKGPDVVARDAGGRILATMVHKSGGRIVDAQITADHRTLWYLSQPVPAEPCYSVVRADIEDRTSAIVAHAMAFSISADGTRLALAGDGDVAQGYCAPPAAGRGSSELAVRNLNTGRTTSTAVQNLSTMQWSPDGSFLVITRCIATQCAAFERVDVSADGAPAVGAGPVGGLVGYAAKNAPPAFGPDGLVVIEATPTARGVDENVDVYGARTLSFARRIATITAPWSVRQVIPSAIDRFAVASSSATGRPALYRIVAGHLVLVRNIDPGAVTAVFPMLR